MANPNLLIRFLPLAGSLYLLLVSIPLSLTDLKSFRLPNRLVLPGISIALLGQLFFSVINNDWWRFYVSLVTSLVVFTLGLSLSIKGLMGMGDTKLLTAISLATSWFSLTNFGISVLVGFGLAGLVALTLRGVFGIPLRTKMPLGPYLLVGHLAAVVKILLTAAVWS